MSKCPYCNNEMKRGFISGSRFQLEWIPEGKKERNTILSKDAGIPLNKLSLFKYNKIEADYCSICNKVIIDISR